MSFYYTEKKRLSLNYLLIISIDFDYMSINQTCVKCSFMPKLVMIIQVYTLLQLQY